jgi:hypothetical protein
MNALHVVVERSFLSLYSLLFCLEVILQVINRDDRKSTSSGCFSILVSSNLSEVRFALTLHAWTRFFFFVECFSNFF